MLRPSPSLLLLPCCLACTGPGPSTGSDTGGSDAEVAATIEGLRTGSVELGTVTLEGVVATSGLTRDASGFFIQDAGGGPETGLYVYVQSGRDALSELSAGDELRIRGRVAEYYGRLELTLADDADLEVVGEAEPVATTLQASAAADELAPYSEGLVRLEGTVLTGCPDLAGHMDLEGETEWGDAFVSVLGGPEDTLSSLTGVLDTALGRLAVHPRSDEDIDGDIQGRGCSSTVAELNASEDEGGVILEQVVATSTVARQGEGFFVQDPGGGESSGIFVSFGWLPGGHGLDPQPGDTLALRGVVMTSDGRRQVALSTADALWIYAETAPTETRLSEQPEDWSPYVGSLVRLEQITATSPTVGGRTDTSWDLPVDDLLASVSLEAGVTYEGITGLVHRSGEDLLLCPRSDEDVGEAGESSAVDATVADVVAGEVEVGAKVRLSDVVAISPVARDDSGFTIQDGSLGEGTGIQVSLSIDDGVLPEVFTGDRLVLEATVGAGGDSGRPQLILLDDTDLSMVGSDDPQPEVFTEAPDDWSGWVDTLVSLHVVTIELGEGGQPSTSWDLDLDDRYTTFSASEGSSYSEIVGVLHDDGTGTLKLAPRSSFDFRE